MQTDKDYQVEHGYLAGWLQAAIGHIKDIANDGSIPPTRRLARIREQIERVEQDISDWEQGRKERYGSL